MQSNTIRYRTAVTVTEIWLKCVDFSYGEVFVTYIFCCCCCCYCCNHSCNNPPSSPPLHPYALQQWRCTDQLCLEVHIIIVFCLQLHNLQLHVLNFFNFLHSYLLSLENCYHFLIVGNSSITPTRNHTSLSSRNLAFC